MKLIILGSGTSHGIPVIGCRCPVCRSDSFYDRRYRTSLYIEGAAGEQIVVDTGPEFRLQALRANITRLDALLITHAHADHLHGLDDVRPLSYAAPLPVYAQAGTILEIQERFAYIFARSTQEGGGLPHLVLHTVTENSFCIGNITITPLPVKHGALDVLGWKFSEQEKHAVYITDTNFVSEQTLQKTLAADVFIIGSLRKNTHATHFSFEQALDCAQRAGAKQIYLTHLCHNHSHSEIAAWCQNRQNQLGLHTIAAPAYDQQEIIL